jgi:hypothetical protein
MMKILLFLCVFISAVFGNIFKFDARKLIGNDLNFFQHKIYTALNVQEKTKSLRNAALHALKPATTIHINALTNALLDANASKVTFLIAMANVF